MNFVHETLDDALREVFQQLGSGEQVTTTKGSSKEIRGVRVEIANPRARLSRTSDRARVFSALGELAWYLAGSADADFICYYIPRYKEFVNDDGLIDGAYGPRLFGEAPDDQVHHVINMLRTRATTRRAVIQLFDRDDLRTASNEVPCTCTLQFFLRDAAVDLVVHMRSNDAYVGLPHDVFAFTMLQEIVAHSLGATLGRYVHMVGSLHLYDKNADRAQAYLEEGLQDPTPMPPMPAGDVWGDISEFLDRERRIRLSLEPRVVPEHLASGYWDDLARLLLAMATKDAVELAKIRSSLSDPYFQLFVQDRELKQEPQGTNAQKL